jgi:hypothetical protein
LTLVASRDLDAAYQACVRTAHWEMAAVNLNRFRDADIQAKVAALSPAQLAAMKQAIPSGVERVSTALLSAQIVVVPHGADTSAVSAARARATELFGSLKAANTALLLSSERIELHILPRPPTKLTDLPEFTGLRGVRTHDGRLYDDLRGVGGQRAGNVIRYALAEEQLINVPGTPTTYAPGFVASHESAHIVHQYAFSPEQTAELRRLYLARRSAGGPWLSPASYTSANQDEYIAQSASAYFRRPYSATDADRAMYTREWLQANDPAMLGFLQTIFR